MTFVRLFQSRLNDVRYSVDLMPFKDVTYNVVCVTTIRWLRLQRRFWSQ